MIVEIPGDQARINQEADAGQSAHPTEAEDGRGEAIVVGLGAIRSRPGPSSGRDVIAAAAGPIQSGGEFMEL